MRTKFITNLAIALSLMASMIRVGAADALPVGTWKVVFGHGVTQNCEVAADGHVTIWEARRQADGKAVLKDGFVEIAFEDDRLERWSMRDGEMAVEHWHPAAAAVDPEKSPVMGVAQKEEQAALEVHEWGTFTLLQGSDGRVIEWYQAPDKLVGLPGFVQRVGFRGKGGFMVGRLDTVRMETPVLYFYPQEAMDVTVTAGFPQGRITEVFPPTVTPFSDRTTWRGSLLAPDSPERSKIPEATGATGRHYAAARAVPDAWLFRNKPLPLPFSIPTTPVEEPVEVDPNLLASLRASAAKTKPVDPIDHFIFYRGAGTRSNFEIIARQLDSPGKFNLMNTGREAIPKLFALQVADGQTSWVSIDQLDPQKWEENRWLHHQTFAFPAPAGPAAVVAGELRREMVAALHADGLTEAEAAAMVATWDDLWFTEPGTRLLAVLPRYIADEMVPITITPTPEKLERVFVARVEIITREVEDVLVSVLDPVGARPEDLAADAKSLAALQLGRYTAGGVQRAKTLINWQVDMRFGRLVQERKEQEELQAAVQGE